MLNIKTGSHKSEITNEELEKALTKFVLLKKEVDNLNEHIKVAKSLIEEHGFYYLGSNKSINFILNDADQNEVKLSFIEKTSIVNPFELKSVVESMGLKFEELVTATYGAKTALKTIVNSKPELKIFLKSEKPTLSVSLN